MALSTYLPLNDSLAYLNSNLSNQTSSETSMICATSLLQCILLSTCLGLLIVCTMIGNSFVIAAVILDRNLQMSVANYLIASLASADLTVSLMVMPIAAYIEISDRWYLGSLICDIWTSFDVLCCTASILHLVAIALDRYWAITNVEYAAKRTVQRIVTMIIIIWTISTIVGVSPHIFGLSSSKTNQSGVCRLTDNLTFQLVSTFAAFYLPLVFMCVIYWKIFQSAKFRIRKKVFNNNNNQAKKTTRPKSNSLSKFRSLNHLKFNDLSRTEPLLKTASIVSNNASNLDLKQPHHQNGGRMQVVSNEETTKCCSIFKIFSQKTSLTEANSIEMRDAHSSKPFNATSYNSSGSSFFNEKTISQTNLKDNNQNNLQAMPRENLITHYEPHTNQVTTSVLCLKDINNNNINDTSCNQNHNNNNNNNNNNLNETNSEISKKTKIRNFNTKKFEQIQKILKKADSVNRNLEKLQNNEIEIEDISLLFKNTISDYNLSISELTEQDNGKNVGSNEEQTVAVPSASQSVETHPIEVKPEQSIDKAASSKQLVLCQNSFEKESIRQTGESNTFSKIQSSNVNTLLKKKAKIDIKRERKAARVLGIIMSCFIVCWLPYFCMQVFIAICKDCSFSILLEQYRIGTILTWSSYLNSLLNPIIYTIFSPDFREAFAKILFGKYRKHSNYKIRR